MKASVSAHKVSYGRAAEARAWLAKAIRRHEAWQRDTHPWHERVELDLLRREAETLLQQPAEKP